MCQLCRTFGFGDWDLCKASVLRVLRFVSGVIQHWWRFGTLFLEKEERSRRILIFFVSFRLWEDLGLVSIERGLRRSFGDFLRILSREPFGDLQRRRRKFFLRI